MAVIEYGSTAQFLRNRALVTHYRIEIRFWTRSPLDRASESIEPREPVQLVGVAQPRPVERIPQDRNRFVVGLQWNGKRMTVLASVGK